MRQQISLRARFLYPCFILPFFQPDDFTRIWVGIERIDRRRIRTIFRKRKRRPKFSCLNAGLVACLSQDIPAFTGDEGDLPRQINEDQTRKDPSGKACKTIVFAVTKKHALRLADAFYEVFPQYVDMAKVVISEGDYRSKNFKAFKKEALPRTAISVDMLDTGVDIPEVMNLAFMKPVQSPIKLQQMLGRGTRSQAACNFLERLPEDGKKEFLVIDFWDNNFSHDAKEAVDTSLPVLVRIFNTRLNLLETYLGGQKNPECQQVIADLRKMVGRIPKDSLLVRHDLLHIVLQKSFFQHVTARNKAVSRYTGRLLREEYPRNDIYKEGCGKNLSG